MDHATLDYFRCAEAFVDLGLRGEPSEQGGFFRIGPDTTCYGHTARTPLAAKPTGKLCDALQDIQFEGLSCQLPFDPTQVVNNLRYERYVGKLSANGWNEGLKMLALNSYYLLRQLLPVGVRKHLQRAWLGRWEKIPFPEWPVDRTVERIFKRLLGVVMRAHGVEEIPFIWFWPGGYLSCAIMTHDVETRSGLNFTDALMKLNDSFGIKASFQLIPERRYQVSENLLREIRARGFEVNVHDLNHDGRLFRDRAEFLQRAAKINQYIRQFRAKGFRSGALYRNIEWYDAFEFSYDMSVPNVGHLDPQWGGCCTTMPYFIGNILELPVTTTQDYSLFHILGEYSTELWKRQIRLILEDHGLISFIVHPDYLLEPRAQAIYMDLLAHLSHLRAEGKLCIALPRDVDEWWRMRNQMKLERRNGAWCIQGPGSELARIAYARFRGDNICYVVER